MNPHKSKRFECLGVLPAGKPALRSPPNRSLPQARRGLMWRTVLLGVLLIRPSMAASCSGLTSPERAQPRGMGPDLGGDVE